MKRIFCCLCASIALVSSMANAARPDDETVSILFAGDIVLDGMPGKEVERGKDPFSAFSSIFANADIRIANLECVVATTGDAADKNFTFRAHPRTLGVLKRHFDAVTLANNHSGDFGRNAFKEMLDLLDQHKLGRFGGGHTLREAHVPLIIERKGLRIALLGYDEFMPRSFEADTNAAGVAWSEDEQVVSDIKDARLHYKADLVIPFMHWGWENELTAGNRQRQLARIMIDAGADAVIGTHPHVVQDVEHYQGKPIIYSIGNFMMDALDNDAQTKGWVLRLKMTRQGVQSWETRLAKISPEGIPSPVPEAQTPCWDKKNDTISVCKNQKNWR